VTTAETEEESIEELHAQEPRDHLHHVATRVRETRKNGHAVLANPDQYPTTARIGRASAVRNADGGHHDHLEQNQGRRCGSVTEVENCLNHEALKSQNALPPTIHHLQARGASLEAHHQTGFTTRNLGGK
jgi:hypothetical protein